MSNDLHNETTGVLLASRLDDAPLMCIATRYSLAGRHLTPRGAAVTR